MIRFLISYISFGDINYVNKIIIEIGKGERKEWNEIKNLFFENDECDVSFL